MPALPPAALAPIPWDEPGYQSKPVPEPVRKACGRTLFPDLCGRVLAFAADPQRANDTRHLAEASARAAIQAGTALSAFGYVYIGGAKNGTRLRLCVRDCTVRIDAAVKNMTAAVAAMKRGAKAEAGQLAGQAAKGCGVCWGSCARFTGEAMVVMIKRARQFERLVMIAGTIILMII
jgi:pectinesterase inhibitor-like protein